MNKKNLEALISQYIERFDELNNVTNNEGYKWDAINHFQKYWDLDAEDFVEMFKNAMSEVKATNLIDNKTTLPLSALFKLLEFDENVEIIKDCFAELYVDDDDLECRLNRISNFAEKINALVQKYFPNSWKFKQDKTCVLWYLNLWRPQENYVFKSKEVGKLVDCIEYGDDFGSGANFSLRKYYAMCERLREELASNERLLSLHNKRIETRKEKICFNDDLHILVYDLIYCAAADYYNFYAGMVINKVSTKERVKNSAINDLRDELNQVKETLKALETNRPTFPDLSNMIVHHKKYGECLVKSCDNDNLYIEVNGAIIPFNKPLNLINKGIIIVDDIAVMKQVVLLNEWEREMELSNAERIRLNLALMKIKK